MSLPARQRKKKRRAVAGQAFEKPSRTARLTLRARRREERSVAVRHARAAVALRSAGKCEACRERPVGELHHVISGVGKRRTTEAEGAVHGLVAARFAAVDERRRQELDRLIKAGLRNTQPEMPSMRGEGETMAEKVKRGQPKPCCGSRAATFQEEP